MDREANNERKIAFKFIRDLWIASANERALMSPEELNQEVETAVQTQLSFQGTTKPPP